MTTFPEYLLMTEDFGLIALAWVPIKNYNFAQTRYTRKSGLYRLEGTAGIVGTAECKVDYVSICNPAIISFRAKYLTEYIKTRLIFPIEEVQLPLLKILGLT